MSISEFFHMGGYAIYVWPAYLIAFIALLVNLVVPIVQRRVLVGKIAKRLQRTERLSR